MWKYANLSIYVNKDSRKPKNVLEGLDDKLAEQDQLRTSVNLVLFIYYIYKNKKKVMFQLHFSNFVMSI